MRYRAVFHPRDVKSETYGKLGKGLTGVSDGGISENEYMDKLTGFVKNQVGKVKQTNNIAQLRSYYQVAAVYYKNKKKGEK